MSSQTLARAHEVGLHLASHPFIYTATRIAGRLGPIVSIPRVGHVVSDLELAKEVLSSPARFAKTGPGALSDALTSVMGDSALVNMDGERHRLLRGRLNSLFTPAYATAMVREIFTQPLQDIAARLRRGEVVDLVRNARVLTGRIACSILGIKLPAGDPDAACLDLYRTGSAFASILTLASGQLDARRIAAARARFDALTSAAQAAYERGDERDVPGRLRAMGLDFAQSRGVIGLLLVAGTETTASVLPRIVAQLIDTGQWSTLRSQRALMPGALAEGLRMTAAVPLMTRNVVEATTLGGRSLRKNDRVIVALFNVVKSPAVAGDPLSFDIERPSNGQGAPIWFGHGPHFCLGASLAQREVETALTSLLDVGELAIRARRYARQAPLPGYERLDLSLTPAAR